jgi:predicted acylesterase/phospholipase RssA
MQGLTVQDTTQSPDQPALPSGNRALARSIRYPRNSAALPLVCSLAFMALQGCVSLLPRSPATPGDADTAGAMPMTVRTLNSDHRYSELSSGEIAGRVRTMAENGPINILALSGGGAGGAFGAGAMVGLTLSGERPQFAVVTGVSAGALIAPYAFLGPAWDRQLTQIYTGGTGEHVLRSRGLGALFGSSMYRGTPLKELVDRYATDSLIEAIAVEARKGRLLLVATTDVNTGEPVVWDLGAIAMHGGEEARTLFRDVLVASASVPGMFPPVVIRVPENGGLHDETHVDGGVTLPFFIAPSPVDMAKASGDRTHDARLYVLIDGQLVEHPRATRLRTTAIVSRSVSAGLNTMMRTTLELTADDAGQRGIQVDYSAIPVSYPYRGAFDFSADTVRPLFQYAYDCARNGRLWTAFRPADDGTAFIPAASAGTAMSCPADDVFIERFAERLR